MKLIRRHLGVWAVAWLSCQVVTLSALVPLACCAAHEGRAAGESCHQPVASDHCEMRGPDGQPCPMHRGVGSEAGSCAMRGTCDAPTVALASLFSPPAVLIDAIGVSLEDSTPLLTISSDRLPSVPASLDTPPPRS